MGIKMVSEHKQRIEQKSLLGDHLEDVMMNLVGKNDTAPHSKGGLVEIRAPYVHFHPILPRLITSSWSSDVAREHPV